MVPALIAVVTLGLGSAAAYTGDIKIVGMPGGQKQTLPATYIRSFRRWSVDGSYHTIERLRTAGDDTFVDPTSTSELWWPSDVASLQIRPALDVLMKGGTPNYALAGLNVRVPPESAADGAEWRNYGLNSQPLAGQWTTFALAVENGFRVECFVGRDIGDKEAGETKGAVRSDEHNLKWERLFPGNLGALDDNPSAHAMFGANRMQKAVEALGVFLSGLDEKSPLSDGFHVVSFPLTEDWIDLPKLEGEEGGYKITCVATAEPDAESLLEMDESLIDMTAASVLTVDVSQTSSGSESKYLPDSYKPLYVT